jgi:hypothetical protein
MQITPPSTAARSSDAARAVCRAPPGTASDGGAAAPAQAVQVAASVAANASLGVRMASGYPVVLESG